jgi:hypothetical protein
MTKLCLIRQKTIWPRHFLTIQKRVEVLFSETEGIVDSNFIGRLVCLTLVPPRPLLADFLGLKRETCHSNDVEVEVTNQVRGRIRLSSQTGAESARHKRWRRVEM